MIIIKPDLVIKWANSNLVLHRVREHLCVFLLCSRISIYLYISEYTCDCAWEFEYAHALCVCMTVCQGKVLQRKGIYIYIQECLLRHGDCYHPPSGKKEGKKTHKHSPIHSLSPPYSLSCTYSVQLSPSLFLYHLQRQLFPPKWGHVRKVCKWNHCSWIRMGHHIP